jgi:hypothetical protein
MIVTDPGYFDNDGNWKLPNFAIDQSAGLIRYPELSRVAFASVDLIDSMHRINTLLSERVMVDLFNAIQSVNVSMGLKWTSANEAKASLVYQSLIAMGIPGKWITKHYLTEKDSHLTCKICAIVISVKDSKRKKWVLEPSVALEGPLHIYDWAIVHYNDNNFYEVVARRLKVGHNYRWNEGESNNHIISVPGKVSLSSKKLQDLRICRVRSQGVFFKKN